MVCVSSRFNGYIRHCIDVLGKESILQIGQRVIQVLVVRIMGSDLRVGTKNVPTLHGLSYLQDIIELNWIEF